MLSNNQLKYLRALQRKKFRQKYNNFLVEGDKMAREVLRHPNISIEAIYALDIWIETNEKLLEFHQSQLNSVKTAELKKISSLSTPNQVLIIAQQLDWSAAPQQLADGLHLYLDGIQDPGNLGAILRIADWFGINSIICSPDTVELYNPKVIQASMGSFLRIPLFYEDLSSIRTRYPVVPFYGMVLEGENLFATTVAEAGIIVMGNEGQGIRSKVLDLLDHRLTIPAHPASGAESLNAAVATAIACALFRRKTFLPTGNVQL